MDRISPAEPDSVAIFVEPGLGIVRRSVIDDDQLKVPVRLLKDVINGLRD